MNFDPRDFISISKELKNGDSEAHIRSMIGRAYYGAFGYAKSKIDFYDESLSVHFKLIELLKKSIYPNQQRAGKILEELHKTRKKADYKYNISIKKNSCVYTISNAEQVIRLMEKED